MTDIKEIERRVCRVLIDSLSLNISESDLNYSESFEEVVGIDSLASLEFLTAIENEFGVAFQEDEIDLGVLRDLPTLIDRIQRRAEDPRSTTEI